MTYLILCLKLLAGPPDSVFKAIFPWLEEEMAAYEERLRFYGPKAADPALVKLLELFRLLRFIILEDAAVLCFKFAHYSPFQYAPFNGKVFRESVLGFANAHRPKYASGHPAFQPQLQMHLCLVPRPPIICGSKSLAEVLKAFYEDMDRSERTPSGCPVKLNSNALLDPVLKTGE